MIYVYANRRHRGRRVSDLETLSVPLQFNTRKAFSLRSFNMFAPPLTALNSSAGWCPHDR